MDEIDCYERNEEYYRDRMNELKAVINHMDENCGSFCVESDGIRVALVSELLKNALCCHIEEVWYLLEESVKASDIWLMVEDAMNFARRKNRQKPGADESSATVEQVEDWLMMQLKQKELEEIAEKTERGRKKPCLDEQKTDEWVDPGQEAT